MQHNSCELNFPDDSGSSPPARDEPEFIYSILIHYGTDNRLIVLNNTPPYRLYSSRVLLYALAQLVGQTVVSIWATSPRLKCAP